MRGKRGRKKKRHRIADSSLTKSGKGNVPLTSHPSLHPSLNRFVLRAPWSHMNKGYTSRRKSTLENLTGACGQDWREEFQHKKPRSLTGHVNDKHLAFHLYLNLFCGSTDTLMKYPLIPITNRSFSTRITEGRKTGYSSCEIPKPWARLRNTIDQGHCYCCKIIPLYFGTTARLCLLFDQTPVCCLTMCMCAKNMAYEKWASAKPGYVPDPCMYMFEVPSRKVNDYRRTVRWRLRE